ncbi:MAG: oligosaccharide flippase family protein [Candidatus Delongbacteria bacterium]|jgi:lipopolysaccharide exporter|nr:oligosaccharide flippase family protein [Candidatus Delongbacteria bacterium]
MKNKGILSDKEFLKNVGKLFSASAIAQAIPFFILPFLTRIYGPEEFGVWVYFLSLSGILSIIITGNYEFAIMLPKTKLDATLVVTSTILLTIGSTLLILFITIIFQNQFNSLLNIEQNDKLIFLIPLMASLFALYRICNIWNNRNNKYGVTAGANISRSAFTTGSQFYSGYYGSSNYFGLIFGSIIGYSVGILMQMKDILIAIKNNISGMKLSSMKALLVKYRKFPQFFLFSELTNYFSSNIPILFLTNLFNSTVAGLYSIPHKFINVPMAMLGTSVSQVYYRKATLLKDDREQLGKVTFDIYKKMILLGIIPMSIIAAYGDIIFNFVLGDKWGISGLYASMLTPWMLLVFATSPISIVFAVLEKQKESLKLNIVLLIIRLAAFLIGGLIFKSAFWAIALFGGTGFIYWLYFSFYVLKISGSDLHKAKWFIVRSFTFIMIPIILSRVVIEWII